MDQYLIADILLCITTMNIMAILPYLNAKSTREIKVLFTSCTGVGIFTGILVWLKSGIPDISYTPSFSISVT
jgi:hypothetical protein